MEKEGMAGSRELRGVGGTGMAGFQEKGRIEVETR
jgi:hypothetical protein